MAGHDAVVKPMTTREVAGLMQDHAALALHGSNDELSMLGLYARELNKQGALDAVTRQMEWNSVIPGLGEVLGNRDARGALQSIDFMASPSNNIHCSADKNWSCERAELKQ